MPAQSMPQPANVEPSAACALSVTGLAEKSALHVEPQSMPVWVDRTMPLPPPIVETETCAVPVPDSVATSWPPGDALTLSEPAFWPTDDGSNATVTVHVSPDA